MIVFLHGAGERGNDLEKVKVHGIPKLFAQDPDWGGLRVITLSPQCPEGIIWDNLVLPLKKLIAGADAAVTFFLSILEEYGPWHGI